MCLANFTLATLAVHTKMIYLRGIKQIQHENNIFKIRRIYFRRNREDSGIDEETQKQVH